MLKRKNAQSVNIAKLIVLSVMMAMLSFVTTTHAANEKMASQQGDSQSDAHGIVREITREMLTVIKESAPDKVGQDVFREKVLEVLDPVVDFDFIARSVMGPYSKGASEAQREEFAKVFKIGLVDTYAKGVSGFGNRDIVTLPPNGDIGGQRRISVEQKIEGSDGTDHLSYTMAQNRQDQWKLINVVLNGVNLGKTFRNQFAQAMVKYGNDIDQVISHWGQEG